MAETWRRKAVAGWRPGAVLEPRFAALLWLLLAVSAFRELLSLRGLGVLQGSFEGAAQGLAGLGLGWLVVIGLSFAPSRPRLRSLGKVWAQGLSVGSLAGSLLALLSVHGGMTRAGGRAPALSAFLLLSALPVGLVLIAMRGIQAGPWPKARLVRWAIGGAVAVATVVLHLPVIGVRECYLGESTAIGDLRAFLSAEAAYQEASGGLFGPPDCLERPTRCLAGYRPDAPTFLGAFAAVRCGYRFTFHPGPAAERGNVRAFVITAVPIRVGRTGTRAFCADGSFALRSSPDGRLPESFAGGCPEDLPVVE